MLLDQYDTNIASMVNLFPRFIPTFVCSRIIRSRNKRKTLNSPMTHVPTPICQSCGMPLTALKYFGTNADKSTTSDYCCYCYQEGKYTEELTLDEMITSSLEYPDSYHSDDGRRLSTPEAELRMRLQLVTLKRWQVKDSTQDEYLTAVNRVLIYMRQHMAQPIDLACLAEVACISRFHFHRIFKAVMNESPGEYLKRIRLETAAFKLRTTSHSLAQIADEIGYQSHYSLSRAFRNHFGQSPSVYRKEPSDLSVPIQRTECAVFLEPEIRIVDRKEVLCIRLVKPHQEIHAYMEGWERLFCLTGKNGMPDHQNQYYSFSHSAPTITRPEKQHIYVATNRITKTRVKTPLGIQQLEGGRYSVFTYQGPHHQLTDVYCFIYRYWLPRSEYYVRDCTMFEHYLNSPRQVEEEQLITEVYIPVAHR